MSLSIVEKHKGKGVYDQKSGKYELKKEKPLVLLLSGISREGVLSTLQSSGRQYKMKELESSPENWDSIVQLFDDYSIECVLVKLSTRAISLMNELEYRDVREKLFSKIGCVPNVVFVFEKILSGDYYSMEWGWTEHENAKEICDPVISRLSHFRFET